MTAFKKERYEVIRNFLSADITKITYLYITKKVELNQCKNGDDQVENTPAFCGDILTDTLLELYLTKAQVISGYSLFPTYTYCRAYKRGDILKRHTDRPACEVSLSVCLGYKPDIKWPIFMNGKSLSLNPGDAVIYHGCEVEHWREEYHGDQHVQLFMHYVRQDGPHKEWKYDKRERLGK